MLSSQWELLETLDVDRGKKDAFKKQIIVA